MGINLQDGAINYYHLDGGIRYTILQGDEIKWPLGEANGCFALATSVQ